MTHQESNQPVFAAISDENGILEYAVQAHDLADAVIAFTPGAITVRIAAEGITWHRLDNPPAGWQQWRDMGTDEYDAMVAAGSQETRGWVSWAVHEAEKRRVDPTNSDLYERGIELLEASTVGALAIYADCADRRYYLANAVDVLSLVRIMASTRDYSAWVEGCSATGDPDGYDTHEDAVRAAHQITNAAAKSAVAAADAGRAAR